MDQALRARGCPICGDVGTDEPRILKYLNKGPHKHSLFKDLRLQTCNGCQSSWADPVPTAEDLGIYYKRNYSPARIGFLNKDQWPIWDSRPASLFLLSRLVTTFKAGDYFVDVGPGNGASLSVAPLMLPKPRIGCIELNEKSIQFFRRHIPDLVTYESMARFVSSIGPETVKLVLSAHSLEHFRPHDLVAELTQIHRALCVGGVFAVEVPFSPVPKTANVRRHSPHLVFFSEEGLTRLLSRAGFDVKICYRAVGRTKRANKYVQEQFSIPSEYGKVSKRFVDRLSALNVGDLVASDSSPEDSFGVVLKCVAIKPSS